MDDKRIFDPSAHLTSISGRAYLEVKWRLVWFRQDCPDGTIITELLHHQPDQFAVFKATVATAAGASATGHGQAKPGDPNQDYLESAETKALGRALAALGFGTQFTSDHEDGEFTDAPRAQRAAPPSQRSGPPSGQGQTTQPQGNRSYPTERQLPYIQAVAQRANVDWDKDANDLIFLATGHISRDGTVPSNPLYQEVFKWLEAHEGSEWIINQKSGHLEPIPF